MTLRCALAVGLAALALTAACSPPPTAVAPDPPAPAPPTGPVPAAEFGPCLDGAPAALSLESLECATVPAPLDAADPGGPTIPVDVVRRPAADPSRRIGPLFVNPGGPGQSPFPLVLADSWPEEIRARFDLVGVVPRGVAGGVAGESVGLDCGPGWSTLRANRLDASDPDDVAAAGTAVDDYVEDCAAAHGDVLPHLGTPDVARDMDRVRAALGEEQISYVGQSYGSSVGQTYARMYPDRLRAWVVDGVVDQSESGPERAAAQARSFERSLATWADACTGPDCPLGPDPVGAVDRVFDRLDDGPLPVPGSPQPLWAGELEVALGSPLYDTATWPSLVESLAAAEAGDPSALAAGSTAYSQQTNENVLSAVNCLDARPAPDRAAAVAAAREVRDVAPRFARTVLLTNLVCEAWPATAAPVDATPPTAAPAPLVIGVTADPATPYEASADLARSLPGATLITVEGGGHLALLRGAECVDDPVTRHLVDGTVPVEDLRC